MHLSSFVMRSSVARRTFCCSGRSDPEPLLSAAVTRDEYTSLKILKICGRSICFTPFLGSFFAEFASLFPGLESRENGTSIVCLRYSISASSMALLHTSSALRMSPDKDDILPARNLTAAGFMMGSCYNRVILSGGQGPSSRWLKMTPKS